jgi:hypothetical protein
MTRAEETRALKKARRQANRVRDLAKRDKQLGIKMLQSNPSEDNMAGPLKDQYNSSISEFDDDMIQGMIDDADPQSLDNTKDYSSSSKNLNNAQHSKNVMKVNV